MEKKRYQTKLGKPKRPKLQDIAPSEQLIEEIEKGIPPPVRPQTPEEMEFGRRVREAILMVTQEFMREHKDEILVRAIDRIRKQDLK